MVVVSLLKITAAPLGVGRTETMEEGMEEESFVGLYLCLVFGSNADSRQL